MSAPAHFPLPGLLTGSSAPICIHTSGGTTWHLGSPMQLFTTSWSRESGWAQDLPDFDSEQTVLLAFGAPGLYDAPAPIEELSTRYPKALMLGCSTAGEIHDMKVSDHSLALAILRFEHTKVACACAEIGDTEGSAAAGEALARQLLAPDLRAVLVISEGSIINGSALVHGLRSVLPPEVVTTGGLAGDGPRFERTWILVDGRPRQGFVSALGLYGERVEIRHGSKGGWDLLGPDRVVTRSKANVLYELDGKPALGLYKRYLGERASELPASALLFPLALRSSAEQEERLVRTVLSVDEEAQSMTFAGNLPEGSIVQLMRANFDRLIEGASEATQMTGHAPGALEGPLLSLAISCVGRRLVLGERVEEELEASMEALPEGTQQVGFYSYGEISPHTTGRCELHNQTMTLTTIREA